MVKTKEQLKKKLTAQEAQRRADSLRNEMEKMREGTETKIGTRGFNDNEVSTGVGISKWSNYRGGEIEGNVGDKYAGVYYDKVVPGVSAEVGSKKRYAGIYTNKKRGIGIYYGKKK